MRAALEAHGHTAFEMTLDMPELDTFVERFILIWNTGSVWSPVENWEAVEPLNAALRAEARKVDSLEFAAAVRTTQRLARPLIAPFGRDFDVLVLPDPHQVGQQIEIIILGQGTL